MKTAPSTPINPWLSLPEKAPFVLADDALHLEVYNEEHRSNTAYHLHLLPLPFQGRPDAPIVLLSLNPGYAESDKDLQTTPYFLDTNLRGSTINVMLSFVNYNYK